MIGGHPGGMQDNRNDQIVWFAVVRDSPKTMSKNNSTRMHSKRGTGYLVEFMALYFLPFSA